MIEVGKINTKYEVNIAIIVILIYFNLFFLFTREKILSVVMLYTCELWYLYRMFSLDCKWNIL